MFYYYLRICPLKMQLLYVDTLYFLLNIINAYREYIYY
jgi:hypothetical protein